MREEKLFLAHLLAYVRKKSFDFLLNCTKNSLNNHFFFKIFAQFAKM